MQLNEYVQIAYNEWLKLSERFQNFELDVFQIMPNHMHGIIILNEPVGAGFTPALNNIAQNNIAQNNVVQNNVAQNNIAQNNIAQNNVAQNNVAQNDAISQTVTINENVTLNETVTLNENGVGASDHKGAEASPAPTVGGIVGAYKSLVANSCLDIYKSKNEIMGKLWQRNYYEHIIRDEQSYNRIAEYIVNNPAKWTLDKFNPGNS